MTHRLSHSTRRHHTLRRLRCLAVIVTAVALASACASRRTPGTSAAPAEAIAGGESAVQALYESGRYGEVVARVAAAADADAEAVWLAAHSHLRLGQTDQAARRFASLPAISGSRAWQATSRLAIASVEGGVDAIDGARAAASEFGADWFVQYELGLAHARRGDFAAAAEAFDRSLDLNPRFAYAYYHAALAYDRQERADLMVNRFETFLRLAPDAPERPEVDAILRTARGR